MLNLIQQQLFTSNVLMCAIIAQLSPLEYFVCVASSGPAGDLPDWRSAHHLCF